MLQMYGHRLIFESETALVLQLILREIGLLLWEKRIQSFEQNIEKYALKYGMKFFAYLVNLTVFLVAYINEKPFKECTHVHLRW